MNNKTKSGMKCILFLFGLLALVLPVQAASFNCAKATTKVEKLICGDAEISKLDEELNAAYKAALKDGEKADTVKQAQKQWIKERNGCPNAECLEMNYRSRIDELHPSQGRFTTLLAKDKPLCEEYKNYVEHEVATKEQDVHYASPMCQRTFGDGYPKFASVKWREINPADYPELAVEAYRYINNSLPWSPPWATSKLSSKEFRDTLGGIKLNYTNNWWHMWLGEADIGNNGHSETLLRVEYGRCGEPSMTGRPPIWSVPVMVVDVTNKRIVNKSEWVSGVTLIPKTPDFQYEGMHSFTQDAFDVFSFSGKTFFDQWEDDWTPPHSIISDPRFAKLTVYTVTQEKTETICRFKFKKQDK